MITPLSQTFLMFHLCMCVKATYGTALYKVMSSEGHLQAALKTAHLQAP